VTFGLAQLPSWLDELERQPVLILLLLVLPLVLLAWWRRTFPRLPLIYLALLPCLVTPTLLWKHDVLPLVLALDASLVGVALLDLLSLPSRSAFAVERDCQQIASLRQNHRVTLTVTNATQRPRRVWLRDDLPQEFEATPPQFALRLAPRSRTTVHYELKASRRGAFGLEQIHLRVASRWGLWQALRSYPLASRINVYPDMKQLSEYAVLARTNRLSLMGVRRTRRIGQDNEFERLRDFTRDDNYKHIDWRSTARRRRLTVKDFQSSQSQRLVFLVDCGRMMTNEAEGLSLLDHALNAMLMLSFVALRQKDAVGLITFSDRIHSSIPARGGSTQMNRLLHAAFDRFPRLVESRYDQAFLHLSARFRKRSLVILISNVIDEVNANQVQRYLGTLVGRHLPLGVLLRDRRMFDAVEVAGPGEAQFFRAAAAAEILHWRHQVLSDLTHKGVLALDVFPEQMTAPLVNQYLEIKARHLL